MDPNNAIPSSITEPTGVAMGVPVPDGADIIGEVSTDSTANIADKTSELSNASSDFMESNSLVTKFVFILGILLIFLYLMRVLVSLMGWFFSNSPTPYITKGITDANTKHSVSVNPNDHNSVPILRSNNARTGIEFTYSVWMYVKDLKGNNNGKYETVFNKGDIGVAMDPSTGLSYLSSPGLYINNAKNELLVRMNVFNKVAEAKEGLYDDIIVKDIPMKKWFNIMIRIENNKLDVFINGLIVQRKNLRGIPRQNYNNIHITPEKPFEGLLSDVRYWNYSLGTYEIYNIISAGPNTSNLTQQTSIAGREPRYLSTKWFFKT
jgi:hypothetical protein